MDLSPPASELKALAQLGAAMRAKETYEGECDDQIAVG